MFTLKKKEPIVLTLPEVVQKYVSQDNITNTDNEIQKTKKIIEFLTEEKSNGYQNSQKIYNTEIIELKQKLKKLQSNKIGYQKIDLSFLSMKRPPNNNETKIPYYPVFSTHAFETKNNNFIKHELSIANHWIVMKNNDPVPPAIFVQFLKIFLKKDVNKKNITKIKPRFSHDPQNEDLYYRIYKHDLNTNLHRHIKNLWAFKISSEFQGVIPSRTREKIDKAKKIFTTEQDCGIFLIKECPHWELQVITLDPLIVGVIGDQGYLIDCFDCTDIETYVKTEFTG